MSHTPLKDAAESCTPWCNCSASINVPPKRCPGVRLRGTWRLSWTTTHPATCGVPPAATLPLPFWCQVFCFKLGITAAGS